MTMTSLNCSKCENFRNPDSQVRLQFLVFSFVKIVVVYCTVANDSASLSVVDYLAIVPSSSGTDKFHKEQEM